MTAGALLPAAAVAAAVSLAAFALRPPPARVAPAPRPSPAPRPVRGRRAARRAVEVAWPDAIDLVVLAIHAGHLPAAALRAALPHIPAVLQPAFAAVVARVDRGHRFADALDELPAALGAVAAPLADQLAMAERDGLPLAPVLDRLADEARHQRRRQSEMAARELPVRLALPLVLCTLPSFALLAIAPLLLAALSSLHR